MEFENALIETLSDDPHAAARELCAFFEKWDGELQKAGTPSMRPHYDEYLKALSMLYVLADINKIQIKDRQLPAGKDEVISKIRLIFKVARQQIDLEHCALETDAFRQAFDRKFGAVFSYEFSDGDLKRIQSLLNELRDLIAATDELEQEHRQRLLKRLEKMQSELYKKVSDVDRFWGLVGDAGIVLAKLGENAKPIVDRVREIAEIVWNIQTRASQLPSNTPLKLLGGK